MTQVGVENPGGSGLAAADVERRYRQGTWLIVGVLAVARLWLSGRLDLQGDEAYFWVWSRHLDWSYLTKGPGLPLLLRASTAFLGTTTLGVRLPSVVASALTSLGLFALGRALHSSRVGFWAVVVANTTPLLSAGSVLATADLPSICCWTWAMLLFWRLRAAGRPWQWAGLGVLLGVGTLVRYVVALEPICFALFYLSGRERRRLREPGFWTMLVTQGLCMAPLLIWQQQRGWITVRQLLERGGLDSSWGFHPHALGEFVLLQLAIVIPYSAGAVAAFLPWATRELEASVRRYLLAMSLPLLFLYLTLAVNRPGQPNWTGPSFVSADLLMVAAFLALAERSAAVRRLNRFTVAAAVASTLVLHLALWHFWLPSGRDPLARLRGSRDLAEQVEAAAARKGAEFVIGGHYQVASLIAFYLADAPTPLPVFTVCSPTPRSQFDLWGEYDDRWRGQDALYVSREREVPTALRAQFAAVEPTAALDARWQGRVVRRYYLTVCRRLQKGCSAGAVTTAP